MPMSDQTRRIPLCNHLFLSSRETASDLNSLGLSLECPLRMRLEGQQQRRRPVSSAVSARRFLPDAWAVARLQSNEAAGLRVLAHLYASFHCNSPLPRPSTRCERSRAPRWPGQEARRGQRRKPACERSANQFPKMPAARSAPDPRLFARFAHFKPSRGVRRAAREEKHRISRAWERSFPCRSLGLAPASDVNGSVSAGALPSPCAAWGRLITSLRPLGGLRKPSCFRTKVFAQEEGP
jgi:hypothetical protein